MNSDMTLEGFKTIFWWEWSHRLLARALGLVFVVPALAFFATGRLKGRLGAASCWPRGCWRWSRSSAGGWSSRA